MLGSSLGLTAGTVLEATGILEPVLRWVNERFRGDNFMKMESLLIFKSYLPGGPLTDSFFENFVRYVGNAIEEYGRKGDESPDRLKTMVENAVTEAKSAETRTAPARMSLMQYVGKMSDELQKLYLERFTVYLENRSAGGKDMDGNIRSFSYAQFEEMAKEKCIKHEDLLVANMLLKSGKFDAFDDALLLLLEHAEPLKPVTSKDPAKSTAEAIADTASKAFAAGSAALSKFGQDDIEYVVQPGDTYESIAQAKGLNAAFLKDHNDGVVLREGMRIHLYDPSKLAQGTIKLINWLY